MPAMKPNAATEAANTILTMRSMIALSTIGGSSDSAATILMSNRLQLKFKTVDGARPRETTL
jgi:hypothetical protein